MFRERVAEHYRSKGYTVHEGARVRGASGNVYVADLVCEGPLGNLLVSFGDAAGIDGPEMGAVRRIAKDLGMTPVLAAESFTAEFRHRAAMNGVVILDKELHPSAGSAKASDIDEWPGFKVGLDRQEFAAHPWPESGRAHPHDPEPSAVRDVHELLEAPVVAQARPTGEQSLLWKRPRADPAPAKPPVASPPTAAPSAVSPAASPVASPSSAASLAPAVAPAPAALPRGAGLEALAKPAPQAAGQAPSSAASFAWLKPRLEAPELEATSLVTAQEPSAILRARQSEVMRAMEARLRNQTRRRRMLLAGAALVAGYALLRMLA